MTSSDVTHAHAGPAGTRRKIFGYEVLEQIGEGAGSRIYAVSNPANSQVYALKHVVRTDDKSIRFVEQLENEFAVGKEVKHPNLRAVVDLHVSRSLMLRVTEAALVMELVDGSPLDVKCPRQISTLLSIFIATAEALHALHRAGYVHCDLKPANILTSDSGEVKVIDLGQACRIGTAKERIQGTPDYIAPEQVKCKPVLPQTDAYNFGATMYWCLTGKKLPTLFTLAKGDNSFLCDAVIPTPATLNPLVSEALSSLVMECVRINPLKRPERLQVLTSRLEAMRQAALRAEALQRTSVA